MTSNIVRSAQLILGEPRISDKLGKDQTDDGNITGPTNNKSKPT